MVNVRDLRLGNWISDMGDGYGRVIAIHDDGDIITTANNLMLPLENYYPINLTSDMLSACGFEKANELSNDAYTKSIDGHRIFVQINLQIISLLASCPNGVRSTVILSYPFKYVHQLQNFYYAILQKELTINLTQPA